MVSFPVALFFISFLGLPPTFSLKRLLVSRKGHEDNNAKAAKDLLFVVDVSLCASRVFIFLRVKSFVFDCFQSCEIVLVY